MCEVRSRVPLQPLPKTGICRVNISPCLPQMGRDRRISYWGSIWLNLGITYMQYFGITCMEILCEYHQSTHPLTKLIIACLIFGFHFVGTMEPWVNTICLQHIKEPDEDVKCRITIWEGLRTPVTCIWKCRKVEVTCYLVEATSPQDPITADTIGVWR